MLSATLAPEVDSRLDACRGRLRSLVAERGLTFQAIDRRLGWRQGPGARRLRPRSPQIALGELLAVLEVAGLSAGAFFAALDPPPGPAEHDSSRAAVDLVDLLDCIAAAVRRELAGSRPAGRRGCLRTGRGRAGVP
jgi:hypothetical protein